MSTENGAGLAPPQFETGDEVYHALVHLDNQGHRVLKLHSGIVEDGREQYSGQPSLRPLVREWVGDSLDTFGDGKLGPSVRREAHRLFPRQRLAELAVEAGLIDSAEAFYPVRLMQDSALADELAVKVAAQSMLNMMQDPSHIRTLKKEK